MKAAGVAPNVVTWSTLLKNCNSLDECEHILSQMKAAGIRPNRFTWTILLTITKTDAKLCLQVFQRMRQEAGEVTAASLSILFTSFLKNPASRRENASNVLKIYRDLIPGNERALLNNSTLPAIFRAFASAHGNHVAEVQALWLKCASLLGGTKEGWPGTSVRETITYHRRYAEKNAVWRLLHELLTINDH
jgi:hypothetical protein